MTYILTESTENIWVLLIGYPFNNTLAVKKSSTVSCFVLLLDDEWQGYPLMFPMPEQTHLKSTAMGSCLPDDIIHLVQQRLLSNKI